MNEPKPIGKKATLVLLLIFIIVGGYLRIVNLDKYTFIVDEFRHVFAAKGIIETGNPVFPSGLPYTRSLFYTYIVTLFFKLFGISDVTARLPSVIFGILAIPLTYYVASRFLNKNVGIISSFLVAFSPYCIFWSRTCRMYSLFQPLYLLLIFYFFKAFEGNKENNNPEFYLNNIKKYILFFLIFILSFHVHSLSILFIPNISVYICFMFFIVALMKGIKPCLSSKYFKAGILILISGLIIILLQIQGLDIGVSGLFSRFVKDPTLWSKGNAYNFNFYRSMLLETYPIFTYFYPIALLVLILKKTKVGIYLGSCFLVPFIALSFIFTWKSERYLFFIFPIFLITVSFLIEQFLYYYWKLLKSATLNFCSKSVIATKSKACLTVVSLTLVFVLYPVLFPWIKKQMQEFVREKLYDFRVYADFIDKMDDKDLIISTEALIIEYYSSRKPDYLIKNNELTEERKYATSFINKKIDHLGGITLINNLKEFKLLDRDGKNIWIITRKYYFDTTAIDADIKNYVKDNYKKHKISGDVFEVYYSGKNM